MRNEKREKEEREKVDWDREENVKTDSVDVEVGARDGRLHIFWLSADKNR